MYNRNVININITTRTVRKRIPQQKPEIKHVYHVETRTIGVPSRPVVYAQDLRNANKTT